jgi:protein-disulfide isomerase
MMTKRADKAARSTALIVALMAMALAYPLQRPSVAAEPLSDAQKQAVESLIRDYIMDHPEVMLESLQAYEVKQRSAQEKAAQKAVADNRDALEADATNPVGGNPKGDVTIVEFFDYRCGYCKKVVPSIQELLKTDHNIRVVFKEFPILGPDSVTAARAALAAWKVAPEKYVPLHVALMEMRGEFSEARVLEAAKKTGIDPEKLKAAMNDPKIQSQLEQNVALAQELQISGTPAFVIGGKVVPGAVDLATLREMVKEARAS